MIQVRNVLVIDDESSWSELIREELAQTFSKVDVADGLSFQQVIAQQPPYDLVVLDLLMPHQKSGREVFEWLKSSEREPRVIIITALQGQESDNADLLWFQERDIPIFAKSNLLGVSEALRAAQCKEAADLDVLIVDDEEEWVRCYQLALLRAGISPARVKVRSNFDDAAALIREQAFDVYILDVYLRTATGLEPQGADLVDLVANGSAAASAPNRHAKLVAIPVSTKDQEYLGSWVGPCQYLRSSPSVPSVYPVFFEKGRMEALLNHITSAVPFLVQR
jgi:CheY-like chemotaxis protein